MKISPFVLGVALALSGLSGAYAQSPAPSPAQNPAQGQAQPAPSQPQAGPSEAERAQQVLAMHQYYLSRKAMFDADKAAYDVVMLGDSLTEGADWSQLFPILSIVNRGIGGDTTEGMLNRLDSVLSASPRKVFMMAGINDIAIFGKPVPEVFERYRTIIDRLRRAKIQVVVQSTLLVGPAFPPAVNVAVRDLDARLQALCGRGVCRYVDLNPALAPAGTLDLRYTTDHLHVNALGYQAWVSQIAPLMAN